MEKIKTQRFLMEFLLQQGNVSAIEKRAVMHAAMLIDAKIVQHGSSFLSTTACPIGSVEFVKGHMEKCGIAIPDHMTYPSCLRRFMGRSIAQMSWGSAKEMGDVFVKPRNDVKKFTGALVRDLVSSPEMPKLPDDYPVWVSEPVQFVSEWRYYVLHGIAIIGQGRYDDGDDSAPRPDIGIVLDAVRVMVENGDAVAGYALDFGVTQTGETILVEVNDGWALGYYRNDNSEESLCHVDYARLLHARWSEIAGLHHSENEFSFPASASSPALYAAQFQNFQEPETRPGCQHPQIGPALPLTSPAA